MLGPGIIKVGRYIVAQPNNVWSMDSGLVSLQKKGHAPGGSFAASKKQLVLGGVVSVSQ